MTRAVIEVGPGTIRRLSAADPAGVDAETVTAALEGLDDPVALLGDEPVSVDELWRDVLRKLCRAEQAPDSLILVHPSWWAASRVDRVSTAARTVADEVVTQHRAWLLGTATAQESVVVEITARVVIISGTAVAAEPRTGEPQRVAAAVARRVVAATSGTAAAVLIDRPGGVGGAGALAAMIADRLRGVDLAVEVVGDDRFARLAAAAFAPGDTNRPVMPRGGRARRRRPMVLPTAGAALAVALAAVGTRAARHDVPAAVLAPTTFLVEGRITLEVPARWPVQRVTGGPGSARVVLTSPSNPQVALHVTQSRVPDESLTATAQSLRSALAEQPAGVFVDFNPAGHHAGRSAVTYREVRAGHDIRWTILLDDAVRISIGCQSPPEDQDAVRQACERAVRSAHKLG